MIECFSGPDGLTTEYTGDRRKPMTGLIDAIQNTLDKRPMRRRIVIEETGEVREPKPGELYVFASLSFKCPQFVTTHAGESWRPEYGPMCIVTVRFEQIPEPLKCGECESPLLGNGSGPCFVCRGGA
jgi:hypothetical protein